jgi:biotin transport system substrate-specific component
MDFGDEHMIKSLLLSEKTTLNTFQKALLLSVILGASSLISFKTPFMPVPWIIQNQLCLMIGFVFGARVGFLTALFFLIEGALGAPFFSLGRSGPGMVFGPTGGYLIAYPLASFCAGALKKILPQKPWATFLNLVGSNLIIYLVGICQLTLFVGLQKAILLGFVPFVAIDLIKSVIATSILHLRKI